MWEELLDYKDFKLDQFVFHDDGTLFERLFYFLSLKISSRPITGGSPVRRSENNRHIKEHILGDLCKAIGLNDQFTSNIVSIHIQRLKENERLSFVLYFILSFPTLLLITTGLFWLTQTINPVAKAVLNHNEFIWNSWVRFQFLILYSINLLFVFVVIRTTKRIADAIVDKYYLDTMCATAAIYLVVELYRDDVLVHPNKRIAFIDRINDLTRIIRFLSIRYISKSQNNQVWLREHFESLELYISERARWAIAPIDTTLNDLRKDFYSLAIALITANYGKFEFTTQKETPKIIYPNRLRRLLSVIPKIIGVLLPVILLILLLWQPSYLERVGIAMNVIVLIILAWVLLAVDAILKLGIVASVISLAKEIKSLK